MNGDGVIGDEVNGGDAGGGDVNGSDMNGGTFTVGAAEASFPVEGHGKGKEVPIPVSPNIEQQGVDDHQEPVKQIESALNAPKVISQLAKKCEKKGHWKIESQKQSYQPEQQNSHISTASTDKHPTTDALPPTSTTNATIDKQPSNKTTEGDMDSVTRRGLYSTRSRGKRSLSSFSSQVSAVIFPALGTSLDSHPQSTDLLHSLKQDEVAVIRKIDLLILPCTK